jgi:hypothetical protein
MAVQCPSLMEVCAYAVLSNHYHLVSHTHWTPTEYLHHTHIMHAHTHTLDRHRFLDELPS